MNHIYFSRIGLCFDIAQSCHLFQLNNFIL